MTLTAESQKTIDAYLATLRNQLRELMDEDARDIVEEIRAHIRDKTSGDASPQSIDATLAALGTPQQLAVRYRTDELLQRAQLSRSPAIVLRSILRWATLSFVGLLVFVLSGVGYCVGGILVVIGIFAAVIGLEATRRLWYGMAGLLVFAAIGVYLYASTASVATGGRPLPLGRPTLQ